MTEYDASKAAARANRAFYRAFEALDVDAMEAVWLDDDRIKCIHPGWELLAGRERVMRSWELIFKNTSTIRFDVTDLAIEIVGDAAWVTNVENIWSDDPVGRFTSQAVATNLFVGTPQGYRMVLHHASPVAQRGGEVIE